MNKVLEYEVGKYIVRVSNYSNHVEQISIKAPDTEYVFLNDEESAILYEALKDAFEPPRKSDTLKPDDPQYWGNYQ